MDTQPEVLEFLKSSEKPQPDESLVKAISISDPGTSLSGAESRN